MTHQHNAQIEPKFAFLIPSDKVSTDLMLTKTLMELRLDAEVSAHYEFQKVLGQGAFCMVFQALDKALKEIIAVKVYKRKMIDDEDFNDLNKEASLLESMDHQSIVKFKSLREIKDRIFLGMEQIKHGTLSDLIEAKRTKKESFSYYEASTIMKSILEAVDYLHKRDIVHRDLKPDNILMDDPCDVSKLKIADFGLSARKMLKGFDASNGRYGTAIFMGPECLLKSVYSKSVDVFACGIIMHMLLTGGKHPLHGVENESF